MDGVTSGECYQRMEGLRGEIQKFCDSIGGKIDELKDEVHCRELQAAQEKTAQGVMAAREKGEVLVAIQKEKTARTTKDLLLEYKTEIMWAILVFLVGGGRVYDLMTYLKVIH
jgi:nucleoside phosphorylase